MDSDGVNQQVGRGIQSKYSLLKDIWKRFALRKSLLIGRLILLQLRTKYEIKKLSKFAQHQKATAFACVSLLVSFLGNWALGSVST